MSRLRFILPPLIIAVGALVLVMLVRTKPQARRAAATSRAALVETVEARWPSAGVRIHGQGVVVPARQVVLQAEVPGRVVWVHPDFVPGGRAPNGVGLVRLDTRDYEAALAQRKATAENARLARDIESGRKTVAEREWKLVGKGKPGARALALREPHLASAEASVAAAEAAVGKAEHDLARATVRAPFNAVILDRKAEVGQVVSPQTPLATLSGTDAYWVRVSIPADALRFVEARASGGRGTRAMVIQRTQRTQTESVGEVIRILADVDPVGRMARVLVEVRDPLGLRTEGPAMPLLLGSFVEIELDGKPLEGALELPETALHDDSHVWVVVDDKLERRAVGVAWRDRAQLLVDGALKAGEAVVTSHVNAPVNGLPVRVATSTRGAIR